ncbi:MAG: FCD domain-containing protein [Magnetovibrio sp.]|nr:FCD domain-containing protein [Magnetovibrio sp.]
MKEKEGIGREAMAAYKRVKQGKISDIIAKQLEEMIAQGVLVPGERLLSERELAQEMEVSRPSLRDALQKLEAKGLIESRKGGGTFVKNFLGPSLTDPLAALLENSPNTAQDFLELRTTLDGIAAYYAALRATEVDRELLTLCFEAMEAAHSTEDPTEEADIDADFHMAIAEATHNVVLLHILRSLFTLLRNGVFFNRMQLYTRPGSRDLLLKQHRAIYESIMNGDPEKARNAAAGHLQYVKEVTQDMGFEETRTEVSQRRLDRYRERLAKLKKKPS